MNEREQLQQVEPRQFRIAEALTDERRVEDNVRSLGRPGDRLAPACLASLAVAPGQPDSGMGCVKRWKRQRSGHLQTLTPREQKSNGIGRADASNSRNGFQGLAL